MARTIGRENWKGQYWVVVRRNGHIEQRGRWSIHQTISYWVETWYPPVPEKCWQVHAKLSMTRGYKGGTIELEAVTYVKAPDMETAKEYIRLEIDKLFTSGDTAFSEVTQIKFFANKIPCSEMESEGVVKWRDEFLKETRRWKQLSIPSFL